MAFAGFQSAQIEMAESKRMGDVPGIQLGKKRLTQLVMLVLTSLVLPALLGFVYTRLNHSKPIDAGSTKDLMKAMKPGADTDELAKDLSSQGASTR